MSVFKPNSIWTVVGAILFLVAMYLVLENFLGASSILGSLFTGSTALIGTLQGRPVSGSGVKVG